jgi:eukaryotic-like serine/threonine-protein kinase
VLEYLEGETLADRLTRGALTIESALAVGIQICAGLDQAHRHGIVHRDLKPGNVMLIGKGTVPQVKLLDFGLAKSTAPLAAGGAGAVTVSTPMTVPGVLLGTLPYISPEQAEGGDADARSDIFAFGAVLYEMVSGRRAFEGRSAASVLAAVLDRDPPPLASLQALSPPALDHIVARCLAKDPDERWQSAGDVMRELRWVASAPPPAAIGAVRRGWSVAWVASTIALAAALAGTAAWTARKTPDRREPVQFSILPPSGTRWSSQASISISPDGRHLAFVAWVGSIEARRLWIHSFGTGESRELAGTEGATRPFWSPDSQHIAFFTGDSTVAGGWELKRIGVGGGAAPSICELRGGPLGGTWNRDGVILIGTNEGLRRVADSGGPGELITHVDREKENAHFGPSFLPDGRHFIYVRGGSSMQRTWMRPKGGASGRLARSPCWLRLATCCSCAAEHSSLTR